MTIWSGGFVCFRPGVILIAPGRKATNSPQWPLERDYANGDGDF